MLLSLFRLTMIVPLLVSAVRIEANSEKLPFGPSGKDKALVEIPRESSAFRRHDARSVDNLDEESPLRKRQSTRNNGHSDQHDTRIRGVGPVETRMARSGDGSLAHKMAKEALKSPRMQQTIHKLTQGAPRKSLHATVKVPARSNARLAHDAKAHGKLVRRKGPKKKKRKRHHRRYRNQHSALLKRGSAKSPLNTRGDTKGPAKKLHGNENSIIKRHQAAIDHKSRHKPSHSKAHEKITAVKVEDSDYVDYSSPFTTEFPVRSTKSHRSRGSGKLRDGENMVERLMRTTTRDPSKKRPGDQGIEYSDYYSEDDVLQDIVANKIPVGVAETRNPNDRFTRQAQNSTSYYNGDLMDRNVQPYYQDYEARGEVLRYNDDTFDNFQDSPTLEHAGFSRDHPRLLEADDASIGDLPNYSPSDDRMENFDAAYPVSAEEIAEQPRIPEQSPDVSDAQNSLDVPDLSNENSQVRPQDSDQFGYSNQYDVPQYPSNFDAHEPPNFNSNYAREPEMENARFSQSRYPIAEDPQFSNNYAVPEAQSLYNYRRAGTNMQRLNDLEQSVINRARVGGSRPSSVNEEDAVGHPQTNFRDHSLDNFPVQLKGNYHDDANDSPSGNAPNAMDLPLGQVLESLGISITTESSTSNSKELSFASNVMEKNNNPVPVSESLDRPLEHILSPSYIRKSPKEDLNRVYGGGNVRGPDHQALKPRNENSNLRDGHARSIENGLPNDNPLTDEGNNDGDRMNISLAVHNTKEVASQILDTIMDELEDLKFNPAKNNKREGSWSTAQAGMKLDMKVVNHSIVVTVSDLASPHFHESLLNGTWNVSGHAPFKRGSPFTLIGADNYTNSIAVFVGSCRVCQGIDTIAGVWSVARQPKDCRDFQVATSVFNDIFRKTKLSSLREKQNAANATGSAAAKKEKKRS